MRVTHVITRLIVGGAQENTVASVTGLQSKPGVEASLVSGVETGPEGSLGAGMDSRTITWLPALVRPIHPWKDIIAWNQLTRLFRKQNPDIVHTHSGKAGILGRLAARRAGVPVIIHTIHGPSFGAFQGQVANEIFRSAEKYTASATTHFVAVADAMIAQYLAAGIGRPEQYSKIFSGFPLEPFLTVSNDPALRSKWRIAPEDIVIGKIARFFKLKGHEDLFKIAPDLVKRCPRIKFLLVGDGPLRLQFEQQARALNLERHFIFTGLVAPSEIPKLAGIMDVLVHLSLREGLARALPQALAAGRPVVAYDCDGAVEVCRENETGFLIQPGDLNQLRMRLMELAEQPTLRERLGQRGKQFVRERFGVEKMADDIYALYSKLLSENTSSRR
jgi:glycosyltransferase involved in cell wall biosynthesis